MKIQGKKRKKAFTLTELLVVVIVIGVLSAVVLPKFNKVIETRKTTEAEEMMAAVRAEQEKRCALGKNYISDLTQMTDIIPATNTKNYLYSVNKTGTGIEAQSKGKYSYTLQMPSYADGRLCCENEAECLKLNKDYPLCSDLIARADYQSGSDCAPETAPTVIECSGSSTQTCGCLGKGTQTRICDTTTGTWSSWGSCSASDLCDCTQITGAQPSADTETCNGCGTRSRSYTCNTENGVWEPGVWSTCSKTEAECTEPEDPCATHPRDTASLEFIDALCCQGDSPYDPSSGEIYDKDLFCCGTIYVCCSYPDGTWGNCESIDSTTLEEKSISCVITGGVSAYSCGIPSSGGGGSSGSGDSGDVEETGGSTQAEKILDCKDSYSCQDFDGVFPTTCRATNCSSRKVSDDGGCLVTCTLVWE